MHSSTKPTSNPFFLYKLQALRFIISYLSTICIISANCLLKLFIFGIFFRSYHLNPTTKLVYPVTLSELDQLDLVNQDIVPSGLYKNHFFDYKDTHIKIECIRMMFQRILNHYVVFVVHEGGILQMSQLWIQKSEQELVQGSHIKYIYRNRKIILKIGNPNNSLKITMKAHSDFSVIENKY